MGQSPHHRHYDVAPSATHPEQAGDVSRRAILVGTVATTAAATLPLASSAYADAPDPGSKQDMMAFLLLSAALAGVHVTSLAPEFTLDSSKDLLEQTPTIDPFNVKDDYFRFINAADEKSAFGKLLQIAKDHRQSAADIIAAVNKGDDDIKFLARSIVLLWYLGSWYDPNKLKENSAPGTRQFIPSQVVSAKAYTQGLVWQIAQAHPMGYSNLQFGYWSREPNDPNNPGDRSNLGFITPTIP
jgi:Membrane bound FAD containing D-sorbitol dehydrogenase